MIDASAQVPHFSLQVIIQHSIMVFSSWLLIWKLFILPLLLMSSCLPSLQSGMQIVGNWIETLRFFFLIVIFAPTSLCCCV